VKAYDLGDALSYSKRRRSVPAKVGKKKAREKEGPIFLWRWEKGKGEQKTGILFVASPHAEGGRLRRVGAGLPGGKENCLEWSARVQEKGRKARARGAAEPGRKRESTHNNEE